MDAYELHDLIKEAVGLIATSDRPSVFSGAGMSQESGLATYRDNDGLWLNEDPDEVATGLALAQHPQRVWDFFQRYRAHVQAAHPNAGHYALAAMETTYLSGLPVITQNIDNLHERAGSRNVLHLHGQLMQNRCTKYCQGIGAASPADMLSDAALLPECPHCGALMRPDVILFGEYLHGYAYEQAQYIAEATDLMLVVGTSGLVAPASRIPLLAQDAGATLIEINPQPSRITPNVDLFIQAPAAITLEHMRQTLEECLR